MPYLTLRTGRKTTEYIASGLLSSWSGCVIRQGTTSNEQRATATDAHSALHPHRSGSKWNTAAILTFPPRGNIVFPLFRAILQGSAIYFDNKFVAGNTKEVRGDFAQKKAHSPAIIQRFQHLFGLGRGGDNTRTGALTEDITG